MAAPVTRDRAPARVRLPAPARGRPPYPARPRQRTRPDRRSLPLRPRPLPAGVVVRFTDAGQRAGGRVCGACHRRLSGAPGQRGPGARRRCRARGTPATRASCPSASQGSTSLSRTVCATAGSDVPRRPDRQPRHAPRHRGGGHARRRRRVVRGDRPTRRGGPCPRRRRSSRHRHPKHAAAGHGGGHRPRRTSHRPRYRDRLQPGVHARGQRRGRLPRARPGGVGIGDPSAADDLPAATPRRPEQARRRPQALYAPLEAPIVVTT